MTSLPQMPMPQLVPISPTHLLLLSRLEYSVLWGEGSSKKSCRRSPAPARILFAGKSPKNPRRHDSACSPRVRRQDAQLSTVV